MRVPSESRKPRLGRAVGVPRRFAVGTGLVILTMYSLLFALLDSLGTPPVAFIAIVFFLTSVGFAQMALFGGRKPREASLLAGGVLLPILYYALLLALYSIGSGPFGRPARGESVAFFLAATPYVVVVGVILGYASGGVTAAVFLFMDRLTRRRAKARLKNMAEPQSPWDEPVTKEMSVVEESSDKPNEEPPIGWDERLFGRLVRILRWLGPYHRDRPWRDAFSLFMLYCVLVGPVMALAFFNAMSLMFALVAVGLAFSATYLVVRPALKLGGVGWCLFFALLSAAGACFITDAVLGQLFIPQETYEWITIDVIGIGALRMVGVGNLWPGICPVVDYVPLWLVAVLGFALGPLLVFFTLLVARVFRRGKPRELERSRLAWGLGTFLAIVAMYGAIHLALARLADSPIQHTMRWLHQCEGALRTTRLMAGTGMMEATELTVNNMSDEDMTGLARFKNITTLFLSGKGLTDRGLAALKEHDAITELMLSDNSCTGSGLAYLPRPDRIESLRISKMPVTDKGLTKSLARFTNLKFLNVSNVSITDATLAGLSQCKELREIRLWDVDITGTGFVHLKDLPKLSQIWCRNAPVGDESLKQISSMKAVTHLWLSRSNVTDVGLAHLAKQKSLQAINLDYTGVGDQGIAHLKGLPQLTTLCLTGTGVTEASMPHLLKMSTLNHLLIAGTSLSASPDNVDTLRKNLPQCSIAR